MRIGDAFGGKEALRVLLIEDSESDALLVRLALEESFESAFVLEVATSVGQALDYLGDTRYDAILLDLGLPDSSGLDGLRVLPDDVALIVLTGNAESGVALSAIREGAQDYLLKDEIEASTLTRAIRYAIERHSLAQQLRETTARLAEANRALEGMVVVDPLTQLLNRRGLGNVFASEVRRLRAAAGPLWALLVDLDDFKQINDNHGYTAGDEAIRGVGRILRKHARDRDHTVRLGGDEFLMLLPDTDPDEAQQLAHAIRGDVEAISIRVPTGAIGCTASMALCPVGRGESSLDGVLAEAHHLLREAKADGKNQLCVSDRTDDRGSLAEVLERLRDAASYYCVVQQICRLDDSRVVGFELFARSLVRGYETPEAFFSLATRSGILGEVDDLAFRACLDQSRGFDAPVHINVYPSTLHAAAPDELSALLGGRDFCLELAEQHTTGNERTLAELLARVRSDRVRLAIDHVGQGHTSLESLLVLEPDFIKVECTWLERMVQAEGARERIDRLLRVASGLGAEIIAEGVENEEQSALLGRLGIRHGQGHAWGRPEKPQKN